MSVESNRAVINRAFDRFKKTKDDIVLQGMVEVAKAGLEYLIEQHESFEPGMIHTQETNTMAYAVGHNGDLIQSGMHNGGDYDMPGSALEKAESLLSGTTGWVAFILSDMEGWYRVDYEMMFLYESREEIKARFKEFFKPIA